MGWERRRWRESRSINVCRKECVIHRGKITNFYEDCLLEISKGNLTTYSSVRLVSIDNLLFIPCCTCGPLGQQLNITTLLNEEDNELQIFCRTVYIKKAVMLATANVLRRKSSLHHWLKHWRLLLHASSLLHCCYKLWLLKIFITTE